MATRHVVAQGDYLAKIARDRGLSDPMTLWNAPENAELRRLRGNPNVLYPGDVVVIPEAQTKQEGGNTEARHRFVLHGSKLRLRIALEQALHEELKDVPCELRIGSEVRTLTTDGSGCLEHEIAPGAERAELVVRGGDSAFRDRLLRLEIGHLDPIDTISGVAARLANLGYLRRPVERDDDPELLAAIQEFQCEHALTVDGVVGPRTREKLREVHGC
jgi:N-acetylmuramoyl-L-alanine amidase